MSLIKRDTNSYRPKTVTFARWTPSTIKDSEIDEFDRPFHCMTHPARVLLLYCAFCEKPVCEKCKITTHARHVKDITGYDALVRAAKKRRSQIVKMVESKEGIIIQTIRTIIFQITESKARLQSRVDNSIRRYQDYAQTHRDKLNISEEDWISNVLYTAGKIFTIMDEKMTFLKEQLFEVDTALRLVRSEIDGVSHAELLSMFGALRSTLECLHQPKWPQEEVLISMQIRSIPDFGSVALQNENGKEKNCSLEFLHEIIEPLVYSRVFDTKLPLLKKSLEDPNARISMTSAAEVYIAFGEYIVAYPLDSRRHKKVSSNVRPLSIMRVRENIIDISSDQYRSLFYITQKAVKAVTQNNKIMKCFPLLATPSAICVTRDGRKDLYIAFYNAGNLLKCSFAGDLLMEFNHPHPRQFYRPRHMSLNYIGDIFFSDDTSSVTVLDANGIWKGAINSDVTTCGFLHPQGISCSYQRHVFVIDANALTKLHIFSEAGTYLQTAVFKNLHDAYLVNVDRTGDVWVAFKDGRLRIYRPDFIPSQRHVH